MNFNDMVKSGYFPFMAEAGGYDNLVNTREARVNAAMKEFEGALRRQQPTNINNVSITKQLIGRAQNPTY